MSAPEEAPDDRVREMKTPRERFLTVAPRRTEQVLVEMDKLERCTNRAAYEYTDEEAREILSALEASYDKIRRGFEGEGGPREPFHLSSQQ